MDVFDVFELQDYTFLRISRGGVAGSTIVSQTAAKGVLKLRSGMVAVTNQETRQSDATLHVRPTESFAGGNLVGHGIRCQGKDYQVIGQTDGRNYETGELEHIRLTLGAADFSSYGEINGS